MAPKKKEERETLSAELLKKAMEEKGMSIRDVAGAVGVTYETIRIMVHKNVAPAPLMVKELARVLGINENELKLAAVADRIRTKFGKIPLELSGKNPELEPIERAWPKLSDDHKKDIISMVQAFASRDEAENHRK